MGNGFGKIFRLTSFGESHGEALGGVVEGCPAGIALSLEKIQDELDRRRPGQSHLSTSRNEADQVEILSGLFEGKTTGMPIGFIIRNTDKNSALYDGLKNIYRSSHADFSWAKKYGIHDYRGGGRASAREHVARVVAGAIGKQVLDKYGIKIRAYTSQIGDVFLQEPCEKIDFDRIEDNVVRCPEPSAAQNMIALLEAVKQAGDSIGGTVSCVIKNVPYGLGEPVFDKLQARLAYAMMGINAAKGFEYGSGFGASTMKGSEHNDIFSVKEGKIRTETNFSGGIQGGITNGEDIYFKVAFKPVPTIMQEQKTVSHSGEEIVITPEGRHDVCVVPRAVPVVEAMAAMVLTDFVLIGQTTIG